MIESFFQQPLGLATIDWVFVAAFFWVCFIALTQSWVRIAVLTLLSLSSVAMLYFFDYRAWVWMAIGFLLFVRLSDISWKVLDKALHEMALRVVLACLLTGLLGSMIYIGLNDGMIKDVWMSSVFGFYWMSLAQPLNSILAF